jgi:hypothetical protein
MTDLNGLPNIKPRVQPHTDRYGGLREWSGPAQGVCWHTTEGGEGITSAEGLAGMMLKSKAQAGGNFAAYHYVVDADSIIPLCREEQEPYAQGGANDALISVCVTGKAGQTPEQWADELSHPALLNMAAITARIAHAHGIPVKRLRGPDLRAGLRGICGHVDVRDAYHLTTHTDPGPFFPWEMMLDLVAELVSPTKPIPVQEDDDMPTHRWRDPRYLNVFIEPQGSTITGKENAALGQYPLIEESHDARIESACWRAWGCTRLQAEQRGLLVKA